VLTSACLSLLGGMNALLPVLRDSLMCTYIDNLTELSLAEVFNQIDGMLDGRLYEAKLLLSISPVHDARSLPD
jgi:hypothetical protein